MRTLVLTALMVIGSSAMADGLGRGYACVFAYTQNGHLVASTSEINWISDGKTQKDQFEETRLVMNKKGEFWTAEIYSRKGKNLATVVIPDENPFEIKLKVDLQTQGAEDPPHFDTLKLSCDPVSFSG